MRSWSLWTTRGAPELYDRKQDPDQMDNLADSPTNAGIIAKLEIELQKELKSIGLNDE